MTAIANAPDPDLRGLGFFYASADMSSSPERAAAKCADAGASWAMILVESVDGRVQPTDRIVAHASALRTAGVRPLIYTFPDPREAGAGGGRDGLRVMVQRAIARARIASVPHVCLDFEPFGGADWNGDQIGRAVRMVQDAGLRASVTVFHRPRWARVRWPAVPIVLQVYERARDPGLLDQTMTVWCERADLIMPAIGTYLGDVARLRSDLAHVRAHRDTAGGLAVWALATTDRAERAILRAHTR